MLSCLNQIDFIRYLIILRVNSSVAFLPRFFALDISNVLGSIISDRLPTSEKKAWRKSLSPLSETIKKIASKKADKKSFIIPNSAWPLNAIIFAYPAKRTFGRDELVFWELKLFREHADHGLFLEVILPALEEASRPTNNPWKERNRIWGNFDIQHIYVARGMQWEPLVSDGKLDLRCRINAHQWREGLDLQTKIRKQFKFLKWITPFDLSHYLNSYLKLGYPDEKEKMKFCKAPPMSLIMHSLIKRLYEMLSDDSNISDDMEQIFNASDCSQLAKAFNCSLNLKIKNKQLKKVPMTWPANQIGIQQFSSIPKNLIPFLELASIFHLGNYSHYGCGTFEVR